MKLTRYIILLGFVAFTASCSSYQKTLKRGSFDEKFAMAMEQYNNADYFKAGELFESISPVALGKPQMEDIKFYYAYTQYHQKAYMMSRYYFQEFIELFPRSEKTEEAIFRAAESRYYQSPRFNLEQTNSYKAINDLQAFLLKYPFSKFKKQASTIVQEMEAKIEIKAFLAAKQYFKIREYKAAVVALENFRLDYPASKKKEEATFFKMKSQYELAIISYVRVEKDGEIIELKKNRLTKVKLFYHEFIDAYPNSELKKDAERMYNSASAQLKVKQKNKK